MIFYTSPRTLKEIAVFYYIEEEFKEKGMPLKQHAPLSGIYLKVYLLLLFLKLIIKKIILDREKLQIKFVMIL